MNTYHILPIALCEGPRDASQQTYRLNAGTKVNSACYVWYIEGSQPKILVDAGARAFMFTEKGVPETDLISVEDGLNRSGLKPEDIEQDVREVYDSTLKVKRRADIIVPLHDPMFITKRTIT